MTDEELKSIFDLLSNAEWTCESVDKLSDYISGLKSEIKKLKTKKTCCSCKHLKYYANMHAWGCVQDDVPQFYLPAEHLTRCPWLCGHWEIL